MSARQTSVVVCTRNRPDKLERCLQSIVLSAVQPLEVIVVDQSDDDQSAAVVRDIATAAAFPIRCMRLDNAGQTKARNAAVKASRGEIVAFTDDDCIVDRHWLGVAERELVDECVSCVCGRSEPASHSERPRQAMLSTLDLRRSAVVSGRRNPIIIGRGNNMAFRKTDLLALGGFNEGIGVGTPIAAADDLDMFCRTLQSGRSILLAPDSVVFHDQPDDWRQVIVKKRGYSLSSAAVLAGRVRLGDWFAGVLLAAKMLYEFGFLFCGGIVRLNRILAAIGWNSFAGSVSGLKCAFDADFHKESRRLYLIAAQSRRSDNVHHCATSTSPMGRRDSASAAHSGSSDTSSRR